MVAFKEEFPYLRTTSGQLFEFNRDWLHAALTRAADEAGYPGWWLTEHVTESIAFYLHLRNDENVVAFNQLSQTVRDVLEAIGYKEICRHFTPAPPPVSISLLDIAYCAGAGYELAFFVPATLCEASPRHENMDARLRRIARGNCLLRSRKTGVRDRAGAS
jgi:hypothetical protein